MTSLTLPLVFLVLAFLLLVVGPMSGPWSLNTLLKSKGSSLDEDLGGDLLFIEGVGLLFRLFWKVV